MSEDAELISAYRPCVGIMVLNAEGLVWLGRRLDAPAEPEGPGTWWQMPQGGIDANEDPSKAALRELAEETGIRSVEVVAESPGWYTYDLPAELRPKAWGGRYRGQRQKWFAMRFTGPDHEICLERPGQPQEFDAWRWARLDELEGLIVPFKRGVYAQVVRDFAAFAGRAAALDLALSNLAHARAVWRDKSAKSLKDCGLAQLLLGSPNAMLAEKSLDLPYRPCVGIMLINQAHRVWVGRRRPKWAAGPAAHFWQMPQGGILPGEGERAAALRELEEETGVRSVEVLAEAPGWLSYDLPDDLIGIALKGRYRGQRQKWFAMRFTGLEQEIDVVPRGRHKAEFEAWRWVAAGQLAGLIVPFKRQVYAEVVREFAGWLR